MRISKQQKQENIEAVLNAVITLSRDRDFHALTMKAIAKEAGIGEATIYNYFPKKEALITGYLDWSLDKAIQKTRQEPLAEMKFTETMHTLIENHLEVLAPAKIFFETSVQSLFVNPIALAHTSVGETKKKYSSFIHEAFDRSVAKGEFTAPPLKDFLLALMWDYHVGVLYYWIKDEEKGSMKTTEFVDLSMKVFDELLRSELFSRVYAVAHFLFKEHILSRLLNRKGFSYEK